MTAQSVVSVSGSLRKGFPSLSWQWYWVECEECGGTVEGQNVRYFRRGSVTFSSRRKKFTSEKWHFFSHSFGRSIRQELLKNTTSLFKDSLFRKLIDTTKVSIWMLLKNVAIRCLPGEWGVLQLTMACLKGSRVRGHSRGLVPIQAGTSHKY